MIYISIDVAKEKHYCYIIDSDGVIINDSLRISNTCDGFKLIYNSILSVLPDKYISNVKIELESTDHYSSNIQFFCTIMALNFPLLIL